VRRIHVRLYYYYSRTAAVDDGGSNVPEIWKPRDLAL